MDQSLIEEARIIADSITAALEQLTKIEEIDAVRQMLAEADELLKRAGERPSDD